MDNSPASISELNFEDLYLGASFARVRTPAGVLTTLPEQFQAEALEILEDCKATLKNRGTAAFSKRIGRHKYRVTAITDDLENNLFILSRSGGKPWPIEKLNLPDKIVSLLGRSDVSGLVLAIGDMATGKTTTISSMFAYRAKALGVYGITIEDPPEYDMNGPHGNGYISQMPVHRENGTMEDLAAHALRSRADMFMVSEIRDAATAMTLMRFAPAGKLIFATLHGKTPEEGLERLQSYCRALDNNESAINSILASALTAIVVLRVHQVLDADEKVIKRRMIQAVTMDGSDSNAIRSSIREGKFSSLAGYFALQKEHAKWSTP